MYKPTKFPLKLKKLVNRSWKGHVWETNWTEKLILIEKGTTYIFSLLRKEKKLSVGVEISKVIDSRVFWKVVNAKASFKVKI